MSDQPLLTATGLFKTYRKHTVSTEVLKGVDLHVQAGEFLSIVGNSGSGKSTLLHLLGTLDRPDKGRIHYEGRRIDNLSSEQRDRMRNGVFGFIFQFYHLLPELTALENVLVPLMISHSVLGWFAQRSKFRQQAKDMLARVGLSHRLHHKPRELSGGEMQRAAIARALIAKPRVLLADEPTGNLDAHIGDEIVQLLRDLNRQEGLTIIMVTHNKEILTATDRVVRIAAGKVEEAVEPCSFPRPLQTDYAAPGAVIAEHL